jgi:hypothetical protein
VNKLLAPPSLWAPAVRGLVAAGAVMVAALPFGAVAQPVGGRFDGLLSQGCALHWKAGAMINTSLPDNSTNQFNLVVRPLNNDPGVMEVQHWATTGNPPTLNWRVPIGTKYPVKNAVAVVHLPAVPMGTTVSYTSDQALQDFFALPTRFPDWAALFAWTPIPAGNATDNGDGTWTIQLGDMPAMSGHAFKFTMTLPSGTTTAQNFLGDVEVTGQYGYGQPATCEPTAVPANNPLALLALAALSALTAGWYLRGRRA